MRGYRVARGVRAWMGGGSLAALCIAALFAGPVAGDPALTLDVAYADGRYRLRADIQIAAPAAAVRARLTDYANLTALNPAIRESRVESAPAPYDARVTTLVRACVQRLFCRELKRVEDVREEPRRLVAVIVPAGSDFSAGRTEWRLYPQPEGVRVSYRAELTPDFLVPPVIGTALVKQGLERELRRLLHNLERLARARA
ncbi:SRPBCC family protein [uncultured Thiohalocapsa sp.]|uniref:SRPBCC family protein n=1 Tax=uncultured Thiohalocapsa sp. TaxID=768990 RepID=UPI0025E7EEC9|nr:SRPBCC family protein [uncultured Thiohalocapsa sp.]